RDPDQAGGGNERAQHDGVRHGPAEDLEGNSGGWHGEDVSGRPRQQLRRRLRVQDQGPAGLDAGEDARIARQVRVLHDHDVGLIDLAAYADAAVRQTHEGLDRRAGPLGAQGREGLHFVAVLERGYREQLRGGDVALGAASVDTDLDFAVRHVQRGVWRRTSRRAKRDV